jgi:hypothetical protein
MSEPNTAWLSAIGSIGGAFGTFVSAGFAAWAAWTSKKSAQAAMLSAKAAQESIPRPVLTIEWSWPITVEGSTGSRNWWPVRNIGDAPAFNVQISPVYLPGNGDPLETRVIQVIPPNRDEPAGQTFAGGNNIHGQTVGFCWQLAKRASMNAPAVALFKLTYEASGGRVFPVPCKLVADLEEGNARVLPVKSWLTTDVHANVHADSDSSR